MRFKPITGTFGAEVTGMDLTTTLSDGDVKELRRAFVEHKVLVVRDQNSMTPDDHVSLGRELGELEVHPFHPRLDGYPEVTVLRTSGVRQTESWHADVTFRPNPSVGSALRAIDIPPVGRDTLFADMNAAFEGLSDHFQRMLSGVKAIHDWRHVFRDGADDGSLPPVQHPVVTTHPITGRRILFVNPTFTTCIAGMKARESAALLDVAYAQLRVPEYQLRLRWAPGTIAIWDNRSTQHALVFDHPAERVMHRVTLVGEVPLAG